MPQLSMGGGHHHLNRGGLDDNLLRGGYWYATDSGVLRADEMGMWFMGL